MISTVLAHVAALIARFVFWCQPSAEPAEYTPAEKAELLATLNPSYRLYIRDEPGQVHRDGVRVG